MTEVSHHASVQDTSCINETEESICMPQAYPVDRSGVYDKQLEQTPRAVLDARARKPQSLLQGSRQG